MVVLVQSWGSVWQERDTRQGATRIWNTSGVIVGGRVQPRSRIFGQVAFGRRARLDLSRGIPTTPSAWIATSVAERGRIRQIQLLARPQRGAAPDRVLVAITERLVGRLSEQSWDPGETELLSFSECGHRQEVMLLMRSFGWLRGSAATAVLELSGPVSSNWRVQI